MKARQIKENNRTNEHCFYASVILVQIVYNIANVLKLLECINVLKLCIKLLLWILHWKIEKLQSQTHTNRKIGIYNN